MRYAILADIHANLAAFHAVLEDIQAKGGVDQIWCLGDVVGYGPDPHECVQLLRQYDHRCVAGNHDWAAIGRIDTKSFNPEAAAAAQWTGQQLTPEDTTYLENLPLTLSHNDFTLAHGSPRDPIWEYLLSTASAQDNFGHFATQFCLVGHSHMPLVFMLSRDICLAYNLPVASPLKLGEQLDFLVRTQSEIGNYERIVSLPPYTPQVWSSFVSFASFSTSVMSSMSTMTYYQVAFGTDVGVNMGVTISVVLILLLIFMELSHPVLISHPIAILGRLRGRFSTVTWILLMITMGIIYTTVVMIIAT